MKEIQDIIFDFVWRGAPDKVRRVTMINTVDRGGLKIIHVDSFANALKTSWIKRYYDPTAIGFWKIFFDYHLTPFGKQFLFRCNFKGTDIAHIRNTFIKQICTAWGVANFTIPTSNFGDQIIWNNSLIRIDNTTIYDRRFHLAGVTYVKDLLNEEGSFFNYVQFIRKYNIPSFPFTRLTGIISAIPRDWKRSMQETVDRSSEDSVIDRLSSITSVSRLIYPRLIRHISLPPRACVKWNASFTLTEDYWAVIFKMPFIALSDTKIQYFQFRFLHRVLGTNKLLYYMNKVESPLCNFCHIETESVEHLFWSCHITSSFLLDAEQLFFGRQFILTNRDFFFGYNLVLDHPMNFFILHCKYYLYICKQNETLPSVNDFYYRMKFVMKVESCINSKNGCTKKAKTRFSMLKDLFNHIPAILGN